MAGRIKVVLHDAACLVGGALAINWLLQIWPLPVWPLWACLLIIACLRRVRTGT